MINLEQWRRSAPLQLQLLVSHLLVMLTGVGLVVGFNQVYQTNWGSATEVFLAGVLMVLLMSISVGRIILQPLKQLEQTMQQVAAGELDARTTIQYPPELRRLGVQLNYLAESVRGVEQQRQEWLDDLIHEMRTPLTIIHANLRMLQSDYPDLIDEPLDLMLGQTTRLRRLATKTYHLAEVDRHVPMNFESVALASLLPLILNALQSAHPQAPPIDLFVPAFLPPVYADREQVEAIVINLLTNAMAYTPAGRITVRAWKSENWVWVAVSDTGIGIPLKDLSRVGHRGWRSELAGRLRPDGTGLGLAITKRLVELQGGRLEVESKEGEGSTFRFCLAIS